MFRNRTSLVGLVLIVMIMVKCGADIIGRAPQGGNQGKSTAVQGSNGQGNQPAPTKNIQAVGKNPPPAAAATVDDDDDDAADSSDDDDEDD